MWGGVSFPVIQGEEIERKEWLAKPQAGLQVSQEFRGCEYLRIISMLVHVIFQNIPEVLSGFVQHEYLRM